MPTASQLQNGGERTNIRLQIDSCLHETCSSDGRWTTFTGDQLGALFASAVLDKYKASGKPLSAFAGPASLLFIFPLNTGSQAN